MDRWLLTGFLTVLFSSAGFADVKKGYELAVTEGESSTIISSCVNALSGDFVVSQDDIVVEGVEPIRLKRSYISGNGKGQFVGWFMHRHLTALFQTFRRTIWVTEESGAELGYYEVLNEKKHKRKKNEPTLFQPVEAALQAAGLTNFSRGTISARTNLKNNKVVLEEDIKTFKVFHANGTERCYAMIPNQKPEKLPNKDKIYTNVIYHLSWEKLANGNLIHYEYDDVNRLTFIKSTNPSATKTYAWVKFIYDDRGKDYFDIRVETSDAKHLIYRNKKQNKEKTAIYLLEQVTCSDFPEEKLEYHGEHKERGPVIHKRVYPEERTLAADYYIPDHNKVGETSVFVNGPSDPTCDRVKELFATVGPDEKLIKTHSFFYQPAVPGQKPGVSEVIEVDGSKTLFRISSQLRLEAIERYDCKERGGALLSSQRLVWGDEKSQDSGNLLCRSFLDGAGNPIFSRRFWYDKEGNIREEKFYGNLSGEGSALTLNSNNLPVENGVEAYGKRYSYSQEGKHLLLKVEEDNGVSVQYAYLEGSDLLTSKLILENGVIRRREFLIYNDDRILVREVVDNGTSPSLHDLTGVTVRRIKQITPRTEDAFYGLPSIVKEKYLDPNTGKEELVRRTNLYYTKEGKLDRKEIFDSENNHRYTLKTTYDAMGRAIEETNAFGQVAKSKYDANGNKIQYEDFSGKLTKKETFDFYNRLIRSEEKGFDNATKVISHRYDQKNNRVATVDHHGNESRFAYNVYGQEIETEFPSVQNVDGDTFRPVVRKKIDCAGRVIESANAKNEITTTTYNARGKPTLIIHPDGTSERYIYSLDGKLKTTIDAEGTTTRCVSDFAERITLKQVFSSSGELLAEERFSFDAFNMLSKTDAEGHTTYYNYDGAGRKISEEFEQEKSFFFYDAMGKLFCSQKGEKRVFTIYNLLDQLIEERTENSAGEVILLTLYEYDSAGNIAKTTRNIDKKEASELFLYDSLRRPIEQVDALGQITHIEYNDHFLNENGQEVLQKTHTDPLGIKTIETYDALDRVVTIEKKDAFATLLSKEELFYDAVGNLSRQVSTLLSSKGSPHQVETRWEYGPQKRLLTLVEASDTKEQRITRYTYTAKGLVHQKIKPDGTVLTYTYDGMGRMIHLTSSDASIDSTFQYSRTSLLTCSINSKTQRQTKRIYDPRGHLIQEILENGLMVQNTYDNQGRRNRLIYPDGTSATYEYDAVHLRKVTRFNKQENPLYSHDFLTYDLSGNLLEEKTISDLGSIFHEFDPLGRHLSRLSAWQEQKIWDFDPDGNIRKMSWTTDQGEDFAEFTYDGLNQLTCERGVFSHTYDYDSHNTRLSKDDERYEIDDLKQLHSTSNTTYIHDLNGNLICKRSSEGTINYRYDALDRLIEVIQPEKWKLSFSYDTLHRRQEKVRYIWKTGQWFEDEKLFFFYDDQNEIGAVSELGRIVQLRVLGRTPQAEIGSAIAIELYGKVYAPLHDLQGNVSALVSLREKRVVESYRYSAFGEENEQSKLSNPWRFSSKRVDDETGLVYFGRRYYDPEIGQWLTPDPQGFDDGPNLYAFVLNNPLVKVDLYGLAGIQLNPGQYQFLEWAARAVDFIGNMIYSFFHHFVPIPKIRDIGKAVGNFLVGNTRGLESHHSQVYTSKGRRQLENSAVIMPGGQNTPLREFQKDIDEISDSWGGIEVTGVYDSTYGHTLDTMESIAGKCGISTNPVKILLQQIRNQIERLGGTGSSGRVYVVPWSQGGITTQLALKELSPEEKKMVAVRSLGSPTLFDGKDLHSTKHYVSRSDPIPLLSPINYVKALFRNNSPVHFVKRQKAGIPFTGHSLSSEPYQTALAEIGREINGREYK